MRSVLQSGTGAPTGTVVCIGGPPGAGKSTLGRHLAREHAMVIADLDSATTPLLESLADHLGTDKRLDSDELARFRPARYACLAGVVRDNHAVGRDVVVVAPFSREAADPLAWETWCALAGTVPTLVWLTVDPQVAAERLAARGFDRDRAGSGRKAAVRPLVPELILHGEESCGGNTLLIQEHLAEERV